jgi:hypothetical protein
MDPGHMTHAGPARPRGPHHHGGLARADRPAGGGAAAGVGPRRSRRSAEWPGVTPSGRLGTGRAGLGPDSVASPAPEPELPGALVALVWA